MSLSDIRPSLETLSLFIYDQDDGRYLCKYRDIGAKFESMLEQARLNEVALCDRLKLYISRHYELFQFIKEKYIDKYDHSWTILNSYQENMVQFGTEVLLQIEKMRPKSIEETEERRKLNRSHC